MQGAVEKVPDSEVHASKALQPLHLHVQNPERSLWVHGCLERAEAWLFPNSHVCWVSAALLSVAFQAGIGCLENCEDNPLFLYLFKYRKPFSPRALLRYNWPKSMVYIMMIWYTYILWNDYHGTMWKGVFFTNFNLLKWCHAQIGQRSPKFQILWTCSLLFFVSNCLFTKIDPRTANYFCESEHSGICISMFASSSVASYSGLFCPSLQIVEELPLAEQLASECSAVNPADQVRQQMVLPDATALLPWAWVVLCCRGGLCTAGATWHP